MVSCDFSSYVPAVANNLKGHICGTPLLYTWYNVFSYGYDTKLDNFRNALYQRLSSEIQKYAFHEIVDVSDLQSVWRTYVGVVLPYMLSYFYDAEKYANDDLLLYMAYHEGFFNAFAGVDWMSEHRFDVRKLSYDFNKWRATGDKSLLEKLYSYGKDEVFHLDKWDMTWRKSVS